MNDDAVYISLEQYRTVNSRLIDYAANWPPCNIIVTFTDLSAGWRMLVPSFVRSFRLNVNDCSLTGAKSVVIITEASVFGARVTQTRRVAP